MYFFTGWQGAFRFCALITSLLFVMALLMRPRKRDAAQREVMRHIPYRVLLKCLLGTHVLTSSKFLVYIAHCILYSSCAGAVVILINQYAVEKTGITLEASSRINIIMVCCVCSR